MRSTAVALVPKCSARVRVLAEFAPASHPPIRYPLAVLAGSTNPEAEPFARYLASDEGRSIFARFGFGTVQ